jgi:hypothetical protein
MLRLKSKVFDRNGTSSTQFHAAARALIAGQSSIAESSIEALSTCKDLPRLINRVVVKDFHSNVVFGQAASPAENATNVSANAGALSQVAQLATVLTGLLEDRSPDEVATMTQELRHVADAAGKSDTQLTMAAMFAVIGVDTKTAQLMKFINQSVTLSAMAFLKSTLTSKHMTKDVRSSDGWEVHISFERANELSNLWMQTTDSCLDERGAPVNLPRPRCRRSLLSRCSKLQPFSTKTANSAPLDVPHQHQHQTSISVSHVRKEQSTDPFGDTSEHFEFSWDVLLRLEPRSLSLMNVELNIRNIQFDASSMPKSKGKQLRKLLAARRVV